MTTEFQHEFNGINLGDKRLNERVRRLSESFLADPQASVNGACHGWAESKAAYRFFDNRKVDPLEILHPHQGATQQRVSNYPVVLLAQDTTELDYSDHPPAGAGPLTSEKRLGFLQHSHMAFTPGGLCLGHITIDIWARDQEGFGESKKRQYNPLETKETFRWLQCYRQACDMVPRVPSTQLISVADCEGDIYELFVEAQLRGEQAAHFVIRSGKQRCLAEIDPQGGPATHLKLQQQVAAAPIVTHRELQLPRTPKRESRLATLEIRACKVHLKAPYRKHTSLPEVKINVVLVRELDPPSDVEPVEWLLVTSLPIDTAEEVLRVVDYYTGRWPIEIYFRIYKTGCQVEQIQLEDASRLRRCLMLYNIVAWRLLYITMLGRSCPELPCDVVFQPEEWKPVWTIVCKDPIPATAPPLSEFLLVLAKLGGHNGRRRDGAPGPKSLWIGIRRMTDFALAWRSFGPQTHANPPPPQIIQELVGN